LEIVHQDDVKKPAEKEVIVLQSRQLSALRLAGQAVKVLELVEWGLIDEAQSLIDSVWDGFNDAAYRRSVERLKVQRYFV
jgi:hypothetical protein